MEKEIYIYHHLGLGDHIICNGLVRNFTKNYEIVHVFCKPHNYENVKYMYRDDSKINIISVGEDYDVNRYIIQKKINDKVLKVGFENLKNCNNKTFDECFYSSIGLDFNMRFDLFYLERNSEIEQKVMSKLNPDGVPYIFIHGDIDKNKIRKDLLIIENPVEYKIFDLPFLLENAEEIHLMESSIKCLTNSLKMIKPKIFYHKYVRNYDEYYNSKSINKLITIE